MRSGPSARAYCATCIGFHPHCGWNGACCVGSAGAWGHRAGVRGLGQAARVHRPAKMHRALRLSNFPLRHDLAGTVGHSLDRPSVLARFSLLHPMPRVRHVRAQKHRQLQPWRLYRATSRAFISGFIAGYSTTPISLRSAQKFGINFARHKCDHRWLQCLMQTAHCTDIPGAHGGSAEAWVGLAGSASR
jgi:hypothetical protein